MYRAIALDTRIYFGEQRHQNTAIGSSIGLTVFALILVVAAYQGRSLTPSGSGFVVAPAATVLVLALWEIGELLARRQMSTTGSHISRSSSARRRLVADS